MRAEVVAGEGGPSGGLRLRPLLVRGAETYRSALYTRPTGACPYNRPCAQKYVGKSQSCMVISGRLIVHAPVALGGGGEGGLCRTDRRVCHQWHHGLGVHKTTAVGVHTRGEHGRDRVLRVRSIVCTNMGSKCPSRSTS